MQIDNNAQSSSKRRGRPVSAAVAAMLTLVFLAVVFLRHDGWNWKSPHPLLLGVLPVGLWWQAIVSILASVMMWLCVTFAWPEELEDVVEEKRE